MKARKPDASPPFWGDDVSRGVVQTSYLGGTSPFSPLPSLLPSLPLPSLPSSPLPSLVPLPLPSP